MSTATKNSSIVYKRLTDSVFDRDIYLVVGPAKDARDFMYTRLNILGHPGDDSDGESISSEGGDFIIWIEKYDDSPFWDGILVHEIMHTTFNVMQHVGVLLCDESEEVYTHYTGSLMRQCKKFLKKVK